MAFKRQLVQRKIFPGQLMTALMIDTDITKILHVSIEKFFLDSNGSFDITFSILYTDGGALQPRWSLGTLDIDTSLTAAQYLSTFKDIEFNSRQEIMFAADAIRMEDNQKTLTVIHAIVTDNITVAGQKQIYSLEKVAPATVTAAGAVNTDASNNIVMNKYLFVPSGTQPVALLLTMGNTPAT